MCQALWGYTKEAYQKVESMEIANSQDCWGRGVAQTMYTHVSKCKNDKIKNKKINKRLLESD
jgi:hypothetical protein